MKRKSQLITIIFGAILAVFLVSIFAGCSSPTGNNVVNIRFDYVVHPDKTESLPLNSKIGNSSYFKNGEWEPEEYDFIGWYTDPLYSPESKVGPDFIVTGDIKLYSRVTMAMKTAFLGSVNGNEFVEVRLFEKMNNPKMKTDFTIKCYDSDNKEIKLNNLQVINDYKSGNLSIKFIFDPLNKKNEEYYFIVSNSSKVIKVIHYVKRPVDILVLMYMDGDNSLDGAIFEDFNEVEEGLYKIDNATSKVEVVTLLDRAGNGDTKLIRMGKDLITDNKVSEYSHDLTSTAPWINGEVSMSSRETVENFLVWAKNSYDIKPETKVILQFSNHGAGPISYNNYSRAMCEDWNKVNKNDATLLLTRDVPIAIKNSGIGKIDLVIQDVCFGGNIEEVYEYRDVADYMLLSPNSMPGKGLNYVSVIGNLQNEECLKEGKLDIPLYLNENVKDFSRFYNYDESIWNYFKKLLIDKDPNDNIQDDSYFNDEAGIKALSMFSKIPMLDSSGTEFEFCLPTISALDVQIVCNVKESLNSIAELLLSNKTKEYNFSDGTKIEYRYLFQNLFKKIYPYIVSTTMKQEGDLCMYDITLLADQIISLVTNNLKKSNNWIEMVTESESLKKNMNDAVIASWRYGYKEAFYYKNYLNKTKEQAYGLSVCGLTFYDEHYVKGLENYYNNELAFGQETKWKDFLYETIN